MRSGTYACSQLGSAGALWKPFDPVGRIESPEPLGQPVEAWRSKLLRDRS